ncbi:hypothetical protein AAFC00_002979 [Neodothiora populina]|uniref:Peptidase M3A/M3B catalytic domain-containing protein n=1 Tax=Neodothiora populina TaxID=2781224 RepID=A0ABR3P906_9PEZI
MLLQSSCLKPPQPPLTYDRSPEEIVELAKVTIISCQEQIDGICSSITREAATFDNVLLQLAYIEGERDSVAQYVALLNGVSPDLKIRQAASDASKLFDMYWTDFYAREDLFLLVQCVVQQAPSLDPESQRYLEKTHRSFLDGGLGLAPGHERKKLISIKSTIQECIQNFMRNLGEKDDELWFNQEDLAGVPQSVVDGLQLSSDGLLRRLTFNKPDVTALLKYARSEDTRRRVFIGDQTIAAANVAIFNDCLILRDEMARLFGHRNFVEYALQDRMAESQSSVESFLDDLHEGLRPAAIEHMRALQQLKRDEMKSTPVNLYVWDVSYYNEQLVKQQHQIDMERGSTYFPAQKVIEGMLEIFEQLFGLVIVEVSSETHSKLTWHPDVRLFSVWDNEAEGGAFNGYLYTDIYPRQGKYGHNANFNINPGFTDRNGRRHHVSTALICNLNYPSATKPSLLQHRQLITLFHELGHGMHDLLSRTQYSRFHGHQVARDFVEMPSQMLEHWCWIPSILQKISCHYSHLSADYSQAWVHENPEAQGQLPPMHLPKDMAESLVHAKDVTAPLEHMRQIALAKFDLEIYGQDSASKTAAVDPSVVYNQKHAELGLVPGPEALGAGYSWGFGHVRTSHFIWGNEAGYYGYKYSEVFSADLFQSAFQPDPMNVDVGRRYRHMVLEKGASQDEKKTLKEFLGREPTLDVFRKEIGL